MLFFELLQIALGNRESLSVAPSAKEWADIYKESERQAVTGLLLHGIDKLPANQRPPQALLFQWIGISEQIRLRNAMLDERSKELIADLSAYGLHPSILKGQGVATYYGDNLRQYRQAGDIDVYVSGGREKAIEYAKSIGQKDISWDYVHLHLQAYKDIEVELHYRVDYSFNVFKNIKLQQWFKRNENLLFFQNGELITPSVEMNLFYMLLHIYRHFMTEGVGLRQLIDYYFVLMSSDRKQPDYKDGMTLEGVLKMFGMWKFAKGIMWVMQKVMGMPAEWVLWKPDQKEGEYILKQVMISGNFGHHDERLKHDGSKLGAIVAILTHNFHMLTHYPLVVLWAPVWIVWHKCWKITR